MSTAKRITTSTENSWGELERLRVALDKAETVIVGAGAGLSTAAGFTYAGERFRRYFADFIEKYGFEDMYSGGFYPFPTREEFWAYWCRYILINRYMDPPVLVYDGLLDLVRDKDYFVLTTNVDHCFQKAGFDKKRLFYTQGDYGLFQCSEPCAQVTYDNETVIRRMVNEQKDMRVPAELLPVCPRCGRPLTMNLRSDDRFVEDAGWHAAAARYMDFIKTRLGSSRVLFLELGVGGNTPGIIKYPFWRMTAEHENAVYACVGRTRAFAPRELGSRAICVNGGIAPALAALGHLPAGGDDDERGGAL